MIREITAMEARKNFGELLNEVKYGKSSILIKRAGKPIAAVIDITLFEKIRDQLDNLADKPDKTYAGIPAEDVSNKIKEVLEDAEDACGE